MASEALKTARAGYATVDKAAEYSGESPWTWRGRAYRGEVESVKPSPRGRLLIPWSEVERIMAEGYRPRAVKASREAIPA